MNRMRQTRGQMILLLTGIVMLGAVCAWGSDLYVGPGQSYTTIQSAINAASNGDTIHVANGTYTEALNIAKNLTIQGESEDGVIVDTSGVSGYGISANGDYTVSLKNFTLIGPPSATYGYGIKVSGENADITIHDVTVENSGRSGIDLNGVAHGDLKGITVINNGGAGLALTDSSNVTVDGITTSGNAWSGMAVYTYGVYYTGGCDNISLTGTNSFGEATGLYTEIENPADPSNPYPITNFNVSLSEFSYTVSSNTHPNFIAYYSGLTTASGAAVVGDPNNSFINDRSNDHFVVVPGLRIQSAVVAATTADTVNVAAGIYCENVDINNGTYLLGADGAVLDGTGLGGTGINVDSGHVTLDNLEVRDFTNGILVYTGSDFVTDWTGLVMSNNTIHSAMGGGGGGTGFGLYIGTESERFWLPTPPWGMAPLTHLLDFTGLEVRGNEIYNTVGAALVLQSITSLAEPLLVVGNNVHDSANAALWIDSSSNILVQGNDFIDSATGIFVSAYSDGYYEGIANQPFDTQDVRILYNIITGNGPYGGVAIYDAFPATIDINYNVITGNSLGVNNWVGGGNVNAILNWWGDANGPSGEGTGAGDSVSTNVIFSPWLGTDPDGNLAAPGVQITGPMLIIVAPVGPEPTGGYLDAAIAGANSADLPYTDTIYVKHGTYDSSEQITDAANIVSEPGSAAHTTLNGDVSINGNGVLIGLPLQGFRMNGNVTVGAGNDAGTSGIHWSDLYGNVTNNGTGTFNAQYDYWGTQLASVIDGRTTGLVDYTPFLPKNADDSYTDIQALLAAGVASGIDPAIDQLWLMTRLGQDVSTFIGYAGVAGAGAFAGAPAGGEINFGGAAGGGGAVEGTLSGTYIIGSPITGQFTITDPVTGNPVTDAAVTTSLLGPDGALVFWGCATYDETTGEYVFSIDTSGLAPGTYELIIQTDDGQSKTVSIEVQAA